MAIVEIVSPIRGGRIAILSALERGQSLHVVTQGKRRYACCAFPATMQDVDWLRKQGLIQSGPNGYSLTDAGRRVLHP